MKSQLYVFLSAVRPPTLSRLFLKPWKFPPRLHFPCLLPSTCLHPIVSFVVQSFHRCDMEGRSQLCNCAWLHTDNPHKQTPTNSPLTAWCQHNRSFKNKPQCAVRAPVSVPLRPPPSPLPRWKNYLCWRWNALLTPALRAPALGDQFHVDLFRLILRPPGPQLSRNPVPYSNSRQLSK